MPQVLSAQEELKRVQAEASSLREQVKQLQQSQQNGKREKLPDVIAGYAMNGKRWNLEEKKWVRDGKFTELYLYALDSEKKPIPNGTYKDHEGKEHEKYKIATVLRIADSSMLKVKAGEARRCNIYWSPSQ